MFNFTAWSLFGTQMIPWAGNHGLYSLPAYDLTDRKSKFAVANKHIRPLGDPNLDLTFSGWQLAHAVKKAECAIPLGPMLTRITALGFVLENSFLFDWSPGNFRLSDDAIGVLDDSSRSGLAGRVAQGIATLYMERQGYAFVDRFSSFCRRNQVAMTQKSGFKAKKMKAPDLVFEKDPNDRALVEAKGGFVGGGQLANIKGELAEALVQLAPWGGQFKPAITKKYAIGAFLRETSDAHNERSLIAVVDPEGGEEEDAREVPPWAIRRSNYAAWLRGMGYTSVSNRISSARSDTRRQRFLVKEIAGAEYAIAPLAFVSQSDWGQVFIDAWEYGRLDPFDFIYSIAYMRGTRAVVAALDFEVLKRISIASANTEWDGLLEVTPRNFPGAEITIQADEERQGSRFADGSFFGAMELESLRRTARTEELSF